MPSVLGQVARDASMLERLSHFFHPDADPWSSLAIELPPQVFGRASNRAFAKYLEGPTRVPVRSLNDICDWLGACEAVADDTLFFEADFWQHPVTFEQLRKGDCEDHALWAWRQLVRLEIPALFVAGLWNQTPHAWVQVRHDGIDGVLETTAKSGGMLVPLVKARHSYCPGLAVDGRLQTYVYQGYQRLHAVARDSGLGALAGRQFEAVILAGGRSSRMGRDKALLRVAGRALAGHARLAAAALGVPVRTIRRDHIPSCGPLSGISTALSSARAPVVLFLACDAPLVTPALLRRVVEPLERGGDAAFSFADGRFGFPFALRASAREVVSGLIQRGELSLQSLAKKLKATRVEVPAGALPETFSVNTPAELAMVRRHFREREASKEPARRNAAKRPPVSRIEARRPVASRRSAS